MEKENEKINILASSDDNYAQHLGVLIQSIINSIENIGRTSIYIVNNNISQINIEKIRTIVEKEPKFELIWIDFDKWRHKLTLNMSWEISISSYARLFIGSMVPEDVHRIIYLDCDMLAMESIGDLWRYDLKNKIAGAVQDRVKDWIKEAIGLTPEEPYFNAGMLLIDLDKWREQKIEEKCLAFLRESNGQVIHHDQGVLNRVLNYDWERLPIQYNLMTIHYLFDERTVNKYYKDKAPFYPDNSVRKALQNPAILHFTPSFTTRPWEYNCKHPLRADYWNILEQTPWCRTKPIRDKRKVYIRMIEWWYRSIWRRIV